MLLALILSACGGGGGSQSSGPAKPAQKSPVLFWGYVGSDGGATETLALVTYDPDNPSAGATTIVNRAALLGEPYPMSHGRYQSGDGSVADYHMRALVYATAGQLFKHDLSKSAASAGPMRLSSEEQAQRACRHQEEQAEFFVFGAADYANFNLSTLVYRVPGADGVCATPDDAWRAVKLGMSASDAPLTLSGEPLAALHDSGNGALLGWLVVRPLAGSGAVPTAQLETVDANFSNARSVATLQFPWRRVAHVPHRGAFAGDVLIASGDQLRRYAVRGGQLSAPLTTVVADARSMLVVADATHVYLVRNDSGEEDILKVPLDGSTPPELWVERVSGPIWDLRASGSHLLYRMWDGTLHAVRKDVLPPAPALRRSLGDGTEAQLTGSGEAFAVNARSAPTSSSGAEQGFALLLGADGGVLADVPNAQLLGYSEPVANTASAARAVLAQTLAASGAGELSFNQAQIKSYNAASGTGDVALGTLARASIEVSGLSATPGYGQLVTLSAVAIDRASGARYFDLYLAETDKVGGLTRITRDIP